MSVRLNLLQVYLKEDPFDEFLKYALALEYKSLGRIEEAYAELKSLIEISPEYLAAYYMTAKYAEELHFPTEALMWYEKGIQKAIEQNNAHTLAELRSALNMLKDEMSDE
ncbi:MAG: tetratricopeptide repeat protein [Bacteroidetes bacterium]|nr:tetratricopeptide repeat protein [Bacteroidota bacterium]